MLIFGGIAVPCAGSCQGHCHQARHTGSTRRAEDAAWSLSWKWFRHISTTHMPIVSHCPSLSPPADFCSTCGAAPLRVCLRKPMSFQTAFCQQSCDLVVWWWLQSLSASANQVVQVLCCLMSHHVTFCAATQPNIFVRPSPSALATRCHEGRGGHQGCRASGSARDLGHGRHNGTSAKSHLGVGCLTKKKSRVWDSRF